MKWTWSNGLHIFKMADDEWNEEEEDKNGRVEVGCCRGTEKEINGKKQRWGWGMGILKNNGYAYH